MGAGHGDKLLVRPSPAHGRSFLLPTIRKLIFRSYWPSSSREWSIDYLGLFTKAYLKRS